MMNTKQLPRPTRRRAVSDLAASLPIPFVVTCAGMGLAWPKGARCPKHDAPLDLLSTCDECLREEAEARALRLPAFGRAPVRLDTICEECGNSTNGGSRYCGFCDPLAD